MTTERLYYIQYIRNYAADYVMWWRENGNGYTFNFEEAGLFPESKALAQERMRPDTDKAWPREVVEAATKQTAITKSALDSSHVRFREAPILRVLRSLPEMTYEQREAQRRSFAYGNVAIENPSVTRAHIDAAAERMKTEA